IVTRADLHRPRVEKARLAFDVSHPLCVLDGAAAAGSPAQHDVLHALVYCAPVHAALAGLSAVLPGAPREVRHARAGSQRFGGRAAPVDARAPRELALDHGHLPARPRQRCGERPACLPRADHDPVELSPIGHAHPLLSLTAHANPTIMWML